MDVRELSYRELSLVIFQIVIVSIKDVTVKTELGRDRERGEWRNGQ